MLTRILGRRENCGLDGWWNMGKNDPNHPRCLFGGGSEKEQMVVNLRDFLQKILMFW